MRLTHGRKVGGFRRPASGHGARWASGAGTVAVRALARENGYGIKDRRRVTADLVVKYEEATASRARERTLAPSACLVALRPGRQPAAAQACCESDGRTSVHGCP